MFDRPSINLGRIAGGDALNKVPDLCTMWVDVRFLPGQDPQEILEQVSQIRDIEIVRTLIHPPVSVARTDPFVRALRDAVSTSRGGEAHSVGRDGASEAAAFIRAGIPAVEFGPAGAGHHGPEEWVSLCGLARYRRALGDFVRLLRCRSRRGPTRCAPIDGGPAPREAARPMTPRRRPVAVRRSASVVVVGCTAGATAVAGLLQIKDIVDVINSTPALSKDVGVQLPAPGAPETLLLVGSDHRAGEPYSAANTDTMMLVRIDDSSRTINVMSIPATSR